MTHTHNFENWPFNQSVDTASFTTRQVLEGSHQILEVYHDHEGEWQFLCGTTLDANDLKVVCMGCMVERDPSILLLATLPSGWCAVRETTTSPWHLEEYADSAEDEG